MATSARIEELRKKFDENPRRYFAPLANEYRKVGDFEQAIFICQEYLPQQPGHMSGHIVFGQALFEAKRLPEARTVFETALTLDPENLIALRHLGDISRDMGETVSARSWYERVLQADPRNEEIAAIMSSMPAAAPPPIARTLETPVTTPPPPEPAVKPVVVSPTAATVVLTAAAVQEMMRARVGSKAEPTATKPTLDDAATVEIRTADPTPALEGLESTTQGETPNTATGALLDMPTGGLLDPDPSAMPFDMPSGGMLGLEPTSASDTPDTIVDPSATMSMEFSLPAAGLPPSAPAPVVEEVHASGGLLDFDSFEIGGSTAPASQPEAVPTGNPVKTDAPVEGGHEGRMDFDFEIPTPAPPPADTVSSVIMAAVEDVVSPAMDLVEAAVPGLLDELPLAVPSIMDAVAAVPTLIMETVSVSNPVASPPAHAPTESLAPTQPVDVASVMEQVNVSRPLSTAADEPPAERTPTPFVTETMAQLYLEQGHRAEAIGIYRQLVAARPNDPDLRDRLAAIESGAGLRPSKPEDARQPIAAEAPLPPPAVRFSVGGPTIRNVLRELFGLGATPNGNGSGDMGPAGELGSIDILFAAESVADELNPLAVAFDGGYVAPSGSIDEVFAGDVR